jgi:hypothetical protein
LDANFGGNSSSPSPSARDDAYLPMEISQYYGGMTREESPE